MRVDRELDQRLPLRIRPAPLDRADADDGEREPRDADAEEEPGQVAADAVLGRVEEEHQQQHHRHEQPEDVEQADDPPGQVSRVGGLRQFACLDRSRHASESNRAPRCRPAEAVTPCSPRPAAVHGLPGADLCSHRAVCPQYATSSAAWPPA